MKGGIIKLKDLRFSFSGSEFEISIPNLTINPGEVTAILGPNGSGKSTLLSLIRGRLKPKKGLIFIDNINLLTLSDLERAAEVGYTPQRSDSQLGFTVEEMVEGGFFRFQKDRPTLPIDKILKRMDLLSLRHRDSSTLSGGEFRRVLLSRLLAQDPRVLLLDEPTGDLDLKYQEKLPKLLREEAQKGKTVIVILHDINQALLYTDKTILIKKGSIIKSGTSKEVITPENIKKVYGVKLDYFFSEKGDYPILGFHSNSDIQRKYPNS